MDGEISVDKRFTTICIFCLVCGVFLLGLFVFLALYEGSESYTLDDIFYTVFFMFFGVTLIVFSCGAMCLNKKAFIRAEDETISAFCQLGFALNCRIEDAAYLDLQNNTLSIRMKNGRKYTLLFLANAADVYRYIHSRMPAEDGALPSKDALLSTISALLPGRTRSGRNAMSFSALTVVLVLLQGWLTGFRKLQEFTGGDWIVFAMFFFLIFSAAAISLVFLVRFSRLNETLRKDGAALDRLLLRTEPLPVGNAYKLFIDEDHWDPYRLTVFSFPDSPQVYFVVESVEKHALRRVYESALFDDYWTLAHELVGLKEIPLP